MRKKILSLLLAAALSAAVFTGCSDSKDNTKTETTTPISQDETTTADNSQQKRVTAKKFQLLRPRGI